VLPEQRLSQSALDLSQEPAKIAGEAQRAHWADGWEVAGKRGHCSSEEEPLPGAKRPGWHRVAYQHRGSCLSSRTTTLAFCRELHESRGSTHIEGLLSRTLWLLFRSTWSIVSDTHFFWFVQPYSTLGLLAFGVPSASVI